MTNPSDPVQEGGGQQKPSEDPKSGYASSAHRGEESKPDVVAVGASAGAVQAFKSLCRQIPPDTGAAFVLIAHLSPDHESHLADLLQADCQVPVVQVSESTALVANQVYVIPPGRNLSTFDAHLCLSPLEEKPRQRATIDHFFRTLAATHDGNSAAIVLTGSGSDGSLGVQEVKAKGGLVVAQSPDEADYDGMPRSAVATGVVDLVLPLREIIDEVLRFLKTAPRVPEPAKESAQEESSLLHILDLISTRTNLDFSRYKTTTLFRRIRRRMQLAHIEDLAHYQKLLSNQPEEASALADDLLITVTRFFRDEEVYALLEKDVIPNLFRDKSAHDEVRVWSVGCSTGEEAYSLAILLMEYAEQLANPPQVRVFASDLHGPSLKKAREGVYTGDVEVDISARRLERFFVRESNAYRIRKEVRDLVVFAPHNLLNDPPFSRIDLIACRNVLIYMQREVQPDIAELFHYALNRDGVLLLGTAETVENTDLFLTENKPHGLYRKRNVPGPELRLPVFPGWRGPIRGRAPSRTPSAENLVSYGELHHQMVERYAPPSLLVSAENKVVHFSERCGRFLTHPGGKPTTSAFLLVREELQLELRTALQSVRENWRPYRSKTLPITLDGETKDVVLHARPNLGTQAHGFVLIIFDEREPGQAETEAPAVGLDDVVVDSSYREMEIELELVKRQLQAATEDYEHSQEEMRASNEELQSTNEELRSTMEELETSKEELQSINEELQTANQENQHKVVELGQLASDLQHFMSATHIATLFLDLDLRIVRFTPTVVGLFNLRAIDRGRPLADLACNLRYENLGEDAKKVLAELASLEREVQDQNGHWYIARLRPYLSDEKRLIGVVVTFIDITERKDAERALRESEHRFRALFESVDEGFCLIEAIVERGAPVDFYIVELNTAFEAHTGLRGVAGHRIREVSPACADFWGDIQDRLADQESLNRCEIFSAGLGRHFEVFAFRVADAGKSHIAILLKDISEQKRTAAALRRARDRDAFRVELADALRLANHSEQVAQLSCQLLAQHLHACQVSYCVVEGRLKGTGASAHIDGDAAGCIVFLPWDNNPDLYQRLIGGESVVIADASHEAILHAKQKQACEGLGVGALISVPIIKENRLIAVLTVYNGQQREWRNSEVTLVKEVLERTWAGIQSLYSLEAMREREAHLSEADQHKNEFLAVLSHELRNPLAPITNALHIIERSEPGSTIAQTAQATVKRQVELLARLVDDLLDLTRVARGKIDLRRCSLELNTLVTQVADDHQSLFKHRELTLETECVKEPVWINADEGRLTQAIGNILQNCLKFTDPGGVARIKLGTHEVDRRVRISITDTGVGMTPSVLANLFQPFVQADQTLDRSQGGLGLGMALTKHLVEMHKGRIWADSPGHGKGAEFVIELPLESHGGPDGESPTPKQRVQSKSLNILVIEDGVDAAQTLCQALELSGHHPEVAYDGPAGIAKACQTQPDVVLCDIGLPGIDGYEVVQRLRRQEGLQSVYCIALSGYAMPEDLQRAKAAGFDLHLSKPANIAQLLDVLESLD